MKLTVLGGIAALLLIAGAVVAAAGNTSAQEADSAAEATPGPPDPTSGEMLVDGLLQPKGMKIGRDGDIYVAESGTGGDTAFKLDGAEFKNGYTGRISKIDPDTGERETVVDDLPSNGSIEFGEALGPADVAFIGDDLYYLQTHAGEAWGFPDFETGIYRVETNGDLTLIADIGEFNRKNPPASIANGAQLDVESGGNPYSMIYRSGNFYVIDGNHNRLLKVSTGGVVTAVTEFPNHPVSTGIAALSSGPFRVAYLGQAPFLPADGKVVSVSTSGVITEGAAGQSMLTDVEYGPGGALYALQFNDTTLAGEELIAPFTGKILRVDGDSFTPLVANLSFTTFLIFDGDTAYVTNDGVNALGTGQIWKIENFSDLEPLALVPPAPPPPAVSPPAVAPTATPRGGTIGGPDTGSGGYLDADENTDSVWLLVAAAVVATLAAGAAAVRARR